MKRKAAAFAAAVAVSSMAAAGVVDDVDPFVGTDGTGHTTPAAWAPSGMVQPGPDSGYGDWRHCSGYVKSDAKIFGFSQTHLSGTGCEALCDVLLQPFLGPDPTVEPSPRRKRHSLEMPATKDPASEAAHPGYYRVSYLDLGRTTTEITASKRVALYRFSVPGGATPRLLVDLQWGNPRGDTRKFVVGSEWSIGDGSRSISGRIAKSAWLRREFYFKLAFNRRFSAKTLPRAASDGADRLVLDFEGGDGPLMAKYACSLSGADGADRNLGEITGWDFESVRAATAREWESLLSRVEIPGSPPERRKVFYTALYHLFLQPTLVSDLGERDLYSSFSLWDTFRAAHPLQALLRPEATAPFVNSLLDGYRRTGRLPVMPYCRHETDCMIGMHSVPVIVDAYLKRRGPGGVGEDAVDWNLAYEAVTNALTVSHPGALKEDWDAYARHGYYPYDVVGGEGVSRTLEVSYDDACAARFAEARGDGRTAAFFRARSCNWTNVFDRTLRLVRGRNSKGEWREPFDPFRFGGAKDWVPYDCTEANAWQYTWHVMQDVPGIVAAQGGRGEFVRRLEGIFSLSHERMSEEHDCTGAMGEYIHGNEPSHHILYFLPRLGDWDFAADRIREICDKLYSGDADGLCGNDDCGQMSAWYVFACLGFYPFDPCGGELALGAPQVPEARIGRFRMLAHGLSETNRRVKSVSFRGRRLDGFSIAAADVLEGGDLVFEMKGASLQ